MCKQLNINIISGSREVFLHRVTWYFAKLLASVVSKNSYWAAVLWRSATSPIKQLKVGGVHGEGAKLNKRYAQWKEGRDLARKVRFWSDVAIEIQLSKGATGGRWTGQQNTWL